MIKVMIIGARRRRQGIGEFLAQAFSMAQADVCAIVGTTAETAAEAQTALHQRYGIQCAAYSSVATALEVETPDIVVICSPFEAHLEQLRLVMQSGAHCLCEKPLWWEQSQDRLAVTRELVDGFRDRGRYLALVAQWPYTLAAFYSLYPQVKDQPITDVEMMLSPMRPGRIMILDAVPHLLSILQHLLGHGQIDNPRLSFSDPDQRHLELDFDYRHATGVTRARFRASVCEQPPRPASYAINGLRVEREIILPEYTLSFVGDSGRVELEDPLQLLVNDFLHKVSTQCTLDRESLIDSIAALEQIYACDSEAPLSQNQATISPSHH